MEFVNPEEIDARFTVAEVADSVPVKCSEPGCTEVHPAPKFALIDHLMKSWVPFTTRAEVDAHLAELASTP